MRPSVVNETEAAPAPKPRPEPFRATIFFDFGEAGIREDAKASLDQVLGAAAADPGASLLIRGYSGSKGEPSDNLLMSAKRANAARDYLVKKGVAEERIATVAFGEAQGSPKVGSPAQKDRGATDTNRRVEIDVQTPQRETAQAPPPDSGI